MFLAQQPLCRVLFLALAPFWQSQRRKIELFLGIMLTNSADDDSG
jgi:hypothetical protein